ncbi:hypothetical protein Bpfe_017978 [Biomphalaria pfeifferi]|uniref:Secreted protein n=1 Tax=Biomphalaria pfeifferi TaxID=112525 RepID=A0AAD8BDH7_BIOPF|nr:hypothetical protein Bpfe_017978 [Biomphalaria pfeifferi]
MFSFRLFGTFWCDILFLWGVCELSLQPRSFVLAAIVCREVFQGLGPLFLYRKLEMELKFWARTGANCGLVMELKFGLVLELTVAL